MNRKITAADIQPGDRLVQADRERGHHFVTVTDVEGAYRYTRVHAEREDGSTVEIAIKSDQTITVH